MNRIEKIIFSCAELIKHFKNGLVVNFEACRDVHKMPLIIMIASFTEIVECRHEA